MKQQKFYWIRLKEFYTGEGYYDNRQKANHGKPYEWFIAEKIEFLGMVMYVGGGYYTDEKTNTIQPFAFSEMFVEVSKHEITRPYTDNELLELYAQEDEINKLFNIL